MKNMGSLEFNFHIKITKVMVCQSYAMYKTGKRVAFSINIMCNNI